MNSGDKSDTSSSNSYGYEPNYFHNKKDSGNEDYDSEERGLHDDGEFGKKIDGKGNKGNAHKVGCDFINFCLVCTQKCRFLGQEVRENRAFVLRSQRGFSLSVWHISRNSCPRNLHH